MEGREVAAGRDAPADYVAGATRNFADECEWAARQGSSPMKLLRTRALARWLAAAGFCLAGHLQPLCAAGPQNVLQMPGISVRTESTPITIILLLTFLTLLPAILLS